MSLAFTHTGPIHLPQELPWADPLDKSEWVVRPIDHRSAVKLVEEVHYAHGASNTSVARLGLYHAEGSELLGAMLWLPPVIGAAKSVHPENPHAVLSLHRLAIREECPHNSATFFIAKAIRLLDERWTKLLTYADSARGHHGGIYAGGNWDYDGPTAPRPYWKLNGQIISPKKGPKTLTAGEMRELGAEMIGRFSKHRYTLDRYHMHAHPPRPYPKREISMFTGQPA